MSAFPQRWVLASASFPSPILAQQSDDVLAELMGKVAQAAIDAQFDEFIGAEHYERSAERKDRRNGFRDRSIDTRMGSIDLAWAVST